MAKRDLKQEEFLFTGEAEPRMVVVDPSAELVGEIVAVWGLPVGEKVRVRLRGHAVDGVAGRLELVRAPEWPLKKEAGLALRVRGVEFTSRQVEGWSLEG